MSTDRDRLIEAVARAICSASGRDPDYAVLATGSSNGDLTVHKRAWAAHIDDARAAILATLRGIREPNFQMRRAADERDGTGDPHADIYRAMIDRLIQDFAPEGKGE